MIPPRPAPVPPSHARAHRTARLAAALLAGVALAASGGCAVVAVTGAAVGVASTVVGTAAGVAVTGVKVGAKAVGKTVEVVTGSGEDD